jgi:hypothetical protein
MERDRERRRKTIGMKEKMKERDGGGEKRPVFVHCSLAVFSHLFTVSSLLDSRCPTTTAP